MSYGGLLQVGTLLGPQSLLFNPRSGGTLPYRGDVLHGLFTDRSEVQRTGQNIWTLLDMVLPQEVATGANLDSGKRY